MGESPVLEEPRLAGALANVIRNGIAEAPAADSSCIRTPIVAGRIERGSDEIVLDAALAQLVSNANWSETALGPSPYELLGEPLVAQPARRLELIEHRAHRIVIECRVELALELGARVLAPREELQRLAADPLGGRRLAQASTSSSGAGAGVSASGVPSSLARSAESRAPATSACSLRN